MGNTAPDKENSLCVCMLHYLVNAKNLQNSIIYTYQEKKVALDKVKFTVEKISDNICN